MDPSQYADFQTERDLVNCGLTQDSINAIKSTSVVTHNGAQHIVPESQTGRFDHAEVRGSEQVASQESSSQSQEYYLRIQLDDQQRMFSRFKNYSDKRISALEKGLSDAIKELNDIKQQMETLKSNQRAQVKAQQNVEPRTQSPDTSTQTPGYGAADNGVHNTAQQNSSSQSASEDKPIDRNKTAPADVKVESIFYCGYQ
ncbi:MAG: hypothetical protein ACQESE_01695 [Nanobdellota archaeon]